MTKMSLSILIMTLLGCLQSCSDDLFDYEQGDMKIRIEQGDNWLHRFDLPLGLSKRNAPQIAVWLEDTVGHYITTIYVTHKAATQDWLVPIRSRTGATAGASSTPTGSACPRARSPLPTAFRAPRHAAVSISASSRPTLSNASLSRSKSTIRPTSTIVFPSRPRPAPTTIRAGARVAVSLPWSTPPGSIWRRVRRASRLPWSATAVPMAARATSLPTFQN